MTQDGRVDRLATLAVFLKPYIITYTMVVKTLRELAAREAARDLPIGPLALPAESITLIHYYVYLAEVGEDHVCARSALCGRLDLLATAHEHGCPWGSDTCYLAATKGALECLRYAHENGCLWDEVTTSEAAHWNKVECLKYAHETGCPWDRSACSIAAAHGSLASLRYARTNGCPWDKNECRRFAVPYPGMVAWIDMQP